MTIHSFFNALRRCKTLQDDGHKTKLRRVLNVFDLTFLGVGSTLGLGVYVLAGSVAKTVAGPAVCLSFLIAAIASAFAGMCYAEFAARIPKAGSAYVYSYVSVGEFIAFTIGWNLVLEYAIGTAAVAKGMSNYIDALAGDAIKNCLKEHMPINVTFMADYPDFFAFSLVALMSVLLAVGVKESTRANNIFTVLNLVTVLVVVIAGATKADIINWKLTDVPPEAGSGGFIPFGFAGIMAGSAKCFFGFVGFDCVATTGEEAKNPKKSIPISIVLSLIIIFCAYFSISTVLTLMLPYYLQDADAPFPHVFQENNMIVVKWIVTVGAIFALCTSLLGAMFPLPRVLYAMGVDGLLFRPLAKINPKTQTPLLSTVLSGLLTGIMASLFNLDQLIDMMSIGTLLAYTIVAISVLILRYEEDNSYAISQPEKNKGNSSSFVIKQILNLNGIKHPNDLSAIISKTTILIFFLVSVVLCGSIVWIMGTGQIVMISIFGAFTLIALIVIARQPKQIVDLTFKVPLIPLIPCISTLMNLYLMVQLDMQTWIRFIIWLVVGYLIYFTYGIRNSLENVNNKEIHAAENNSIDKKSSITHENESQLTKF